MVLKYARVNNSGVKTRLVIEANSRNLSVALIKEEIEGLGILIKEMWHFKRLSINSLAFGCQIKDETVATIDYRAYLFKE